MIDFTFQMFLKNIKMTRSTNESIGLEAKLSFPEFNFF